MSQSRFWLSFHKEYVDAAAAKKKALEDNPEGVYQVRKAKDGFRLVQRLKSNEATVVTENHRPKKRGKRRRTQDDFSWVGKG